LSKIGRAAGLGALLQCAVQGIALAVGSAHN
jgi:hypothetical protein